MKRVYQYFSDLHLERRLDIPKITQVADYLILAGDIGQPNTEIYNEFFSYIGKKYSKVYVVDGNHEWFKTDLDKNNNTRFTEYNNIYLLENKYILCNETNTLIAGCTLWTPTTNKKKNEYSIDFITKICSSNEHYKKIIITHHLPSYKLIHKKYTNWSNKDRYANNLDSLLTNINSPDIWICGHSHSVMDVKIGKTRCFINTFGHTINKTFTI